MLSEDDVDWDGPLPIVLVQNEQDEYVYIDQGDGAEARAAEWASDNGGPFMFDVMDQRCPHCTRVYWHEAPTGSEATGWHCPHCGGLLVDGDGEVFIGAVIASARRKFADASEEDLRALFVEIREALEGDSNDAEHEALASVADYFGIPWDNEY